MKKFTTMTMLTMSAVITPVSADTIFGVYAGISSWNAEGDGSFGSINDGVTSNANFGFEKDAQKHFYIAVEHPIPLLPNVKVTHNPLEMSGSGIIDGTFEFGGTSFTTTAQLTTDVDLTSTDYIFYYEIFDNDLISLDAGLNVKNIDGSIFLVSNEDPPQEATETFDGFIPMFYANVEIGILTTGLHLFAEGNVLNYDNNTLHDYQLGIGYAVVDNLAVDVTMHLGYRSVKLGLNDIDGVNTDLEFDGAFFGVELHF